MILENLAARSADPASCAPLPAWVAPLSFEQLATTIDDAHVGAGVHRLLLETHTNLTLPELAWTQRRVQRILSRQGAEQVAHVLIEFDPSFQRLEVHHVRVLRGEEAIEHARREAFQLLRRETDLNRSVLNGRMTASLVIPDLRTDDVVEIAITLYGANPALGSKYSAWAGFDAFAPWARTRFRLLRPSRRVVFEKDFNDPPKAQVRQDGEFVHSLRELAGQARLDREELTPSWTMESPSVQFSEYDGWGEVARLFAPYYGAELPPELESVVDAIGARSARPGDRALAWLGFVQQELRYFGLSLGEGGFVPRPAEEVWRTRFGDCKDAVLLYVAGARRLGLDACPALISATHGRLLPDFLPSATVFHHCIARLRIDGRSYWLDPTMRLQSGDLDVVAQPFGGWALPLADGVSALEPLNDPGVRHFLDFSERLELGSKPDAAAVYVRTVACRFWAADQLRGRIAVEGTGPYAREVVKALQANWPALEQEGDVEVDDDVASNRLTVSSRYKVRELWRAADKNRLRLILGDEAFAGQLATLKAGERRGDIYVGWPRKATRRVIVAMPRTWRGQGWSKVVERGALRYASTLSFAGKTITYDREFVSDAPTHPATDAQGYRDVVAQLTQNQLSLYARERFGRIWPVGRKPSAWRIIYFVIVTALLLLMIAGRLRR